MLTTPFPLRVLVERSASATSGMLTIPWAPPGAKAAFIGSRLVVERSASALVATGSPRGLRRSRMTTVVGGPEQQMRAQVVLFLYSHLLELLERQLRLLLRLVVMTRALVVMTRMLSARAELEVLQLA